MVIDAKTPDAPPPSYSPPPGVSSYQPPPAPVPAAAAPGPSIPQQPAQPAPYPPSPPQQQPSQMDQAQWQGQQYRNQCSYFTRQYMHVAHEATMMLRHLSVCAVSYVQSYYSLSA
ncbi:hypothetical protein BV25DRAFT_1989112 [Artomyces pyxidatus]|uniref:Uncharacterized protein n=1 Tax=Artomyces pyxidatus TaxID=48021 RepID=A0ACB8T9B0_9AGAM|nr:hypothetical protein BV25DRAFT_1989112 [Artomyces pyxidatus]